MNALIWRKGASGMSATPSSGEAVQVHSADRFPTRQYSYRPRGTAATAEFAQAAATALAPGVYRFRLGRDDAPQSVSAAEIASTLHDPFATLVLGAGKLPTTLRELLAILDAVNAPDGLPQQSSFVVADGGQIPWSPATEDVARQFRFLIVRSKDSQIPDLFVS